MNQSTTGVVSLCHDDVGGIQLCRKGGIGDSKLETSIPRVRVQLSAQG
ncbi:MAG: hypothetical protein AB7L28_15160 [Kofleriaceae bacterium]